ncbi:MAG: S8 family serine peptidase [Candidatus Bipolaricaulia bacterium]
MKLRRALCTVSIAVLFFAFAAWAQSAGVWVGEIEIVGLSPFEISFRFTNDEKVPIQNIDGSAMLMDRFGQPIEQIPLARFTAAPEAAQTVHVQSRWEFQQVGIYLLEVTLDIGEGRLVSSSLGFRILPVKLPLAPAAESDGEGLYTVHQQPVSWGLVRILAPEAWAITHGDADVVVAVIDSGIDYSIDQIKGSLWVNALEIPGNRIDDDRNGYVDDVRGWDFRDGDNDSLSGSALHHHGTIVASIIAAQPGDLPIVGVAPGVRIMDVRFLDSSNTFRASDWKTFAEAIEYAVDNGADIINMSIFANGRPPRDFEQALERASSRGVIIVGITGNKGDAQVMYPGKYDSVLAVSATTETDLLASFSNRGSEVALCAPGQSITSLTKGGRATTQSGTSFAAPHVSGILALLLSVDPHISPAAAVGILEATAIDLGPRGDDDMYGSGLVNALEALRAAGR